MQFGNLKKLFFSLNFNKPFPRIKTIRHWADSLKRQLNLQMSFWKY